MVVEEAAEEAAEPVAEEELEALCEDEVVLEERLFQEYAIS